MRESSPALGSAQIVQRNFCRESHKLRNACVGPLESSARDHRSGSQITLQISASICSIEPVASITRMRCGSRAASCR